MNVSPIRDWRIPGCGPFCGPTRHSPRSHELYGLRLGIMAATVQPTLPTVVRTGPLVIDLAAHLVTVNGRTVKPSGREWELLRFLALRIGQRIPAERIEESIWNDTTKQGHLARVFVSRLRRRLGPEGGRLIQSGSTGNPGLLLLREEPV